MQKECFRMNLGTYIINSDTIVFRRMPGDDDLGM